MNQTRWIPLAATLAASLAVASVAHATVPALLPVQGTLVDADGFPYDGEGTLVLSLYDAATGGTPIFRTTRSVMFDDGVFTLALGEIEDLDPYLFQDHEHLYMGIRLGDDAEMTPRLALGSSPWAFGSHHSAEADDSALLEGRPASDFRLVADPVSWSELVDIPTDQDSLGHLACADGETIRFDAPSGLWACEAWFEEVDPVFGASPASGISNDDIARWNDAVARGDHGDVGYLTAESDPDFHASPSAGITDSHIARWETASAHGDHADAGYLQVESDPVFQSSFAASITDTEIANWNTAASWGDHGTFGYLTVESDPVFDASPASAILEAQIEDWDEAFAWGDHATFGYLLTESDPHFAAAPAANISLADISRWNAGTTNGDHAGVGYLTSESDPHFTASPAAGIGAADINAWDLAHSWGNHADAGYLTTESDPVFGASPASHISMDNLFEWSLAYSWGNHADAGYLTTEVDPVYGASPAAGIAAGDIANWNEAHSWGDHAAEGYLTTEVDPVYSASAAAGIDADDIANWDEAYSWGDHADAGYLTTETDPIFNASPAAGITNGDIQDWDEAHSWGNHANFNYLNNTAATVSSNVVMPYVVMGSDKLNDYTTMTADDEVRNVSLPFSFTIGGQTYDTIGISSNGWVEFGGYSTGVGSRNRNHSLFANTCMPNRNISKPFVAAYWDDLEGTTKWGWSGEAGGRIFHIGWQSVTYASRKGVNMAMQIHEGSGNITVQYVPTGAAMARGDSATIGFQSNVNSPWSLGCNAQMLWFYTGEFSWSVNVPQNLNGTSNRGAGIAASEHPWYVESGAPVMGTDIARKGYN